MREEIPGYEVTDGPRIDYIAILPTSNSPTANGTIINNVTNAVIEWTDPGFCSLVVTSKLDWYCASNNTSGTSTNSSVTPFTVGRMDTFKLTDASNTNSSKQDTTDDDATPTNNILFLAEDTNGNARVILNLTRTPTNANVGNLFKWQISGNGWTPASGDFSVGTITSVWTDAGGTVDREFTVTVVCDCGAGGDCENCAYRRMLKIDVVKVEFGSGFDRVSPGRTQMISLVTSPNPLPSGVSVSISAKRTKGTLGTATPIPTNATCSTNISIIGGEQSGFTTNMVVVAELLTSKFTNDQPFTVCAHPTNFHQTVGVVTGIPGFPGSKLFFQYQWNSDSIPTNNSSLNEVLVGEHVDYPGSSTNYTYQFPSPPFGPLWLVNDPTVLYVPGSDGSNGDEINWKNDWSQPYSTTDVCSVQNWRFHCNRCMTNTNFRDLEWGVVLLGPTNIHRYVEETAPGSGIWQYRATKNDLSTVPVILP